MITVVGMGPGGDDYITPAARKAIAAADVLIGSDKWLPVAAAEGKKLMPLRHSAEFTDRVARLAANRDVVVLVSGDPGLFSYVGRLRRDLSGVEIAVVPGISSVQVFFAKLGLDWDRVVFISLHGRPIDNLAPALSDGARIVCFTDDKNDAAAVGAFLKNVGYGGQAAIGERLSEAGERVTKLPVRELDQFKSDGAALVYLELNYA